MLIFREKRQFFELTIKKERKRRSSEFLGMQNLKFFRKIGHSYGWNRKFLRPDSRPPRLRTRLTPLPIGLCFWPTFCCMFASPSVRVDFSVGLNVYYYLPAW